MHVMTRGRQRAATRLARAGTHRRAGAVVVGLALVAAACSTSTEAGTDAPAATFARASGEGLALTEPIAQVSDLIGPWDEDAPWTIVGSVFDPESSATVAATWTSDDGRRWEAGRVPPSSRGRGESMAAAVPTDRGLLAVGKIGEGPDADAAVWLQEDGDWKLTRPEAMAGDHEQWAFAVARGEGGILVAGGESVWGEVRPRLWFSPDGESWTTVDGGPGGPLDATGEESVRDITAVGSGFVAVGSRTLDSEQDGVVWHSPDGESWEQVDAPTVAGDGRQELLTVTTADGMVVAGGYSEHGDDGQGKPFVWRSHEGVEWGAGKGPLKVSDRRIGARDLAVRSLSVGDKGLVAAGGNDWQPQVWRSPDAGATWESLPDPVHGEMFQDGVAIRDAVGAQEVTVALGTEPSVLLLAGARWEDATGDAFPRGGEQPFATSVASGAEATVAAGGRYTAPTGDQRETYSGQVWRHVDGGWDAVDSEHLSGAHVLDVTAFKGGFAAVGIEDFGRADERKDVSANVEPDGIVWVSPDAESWARIGSKDTRIDEAWLEYLDDPSPEQAGAIVDVETSAPPQSVDPAGGEGTRSLGAVAPLGSGFLAVGTVYESGDADPIVIRSPDGREITGEQPVHTGPGIQQYNDVCVTADNASVAVGSSGTNRAFDVIVATRSAEGAWASASDPSFEGPGSQQAYACAASEEGFIVVGFDDRSGGSDARIWTSEDGGEWTALESGLLGGTGDQWASAVTAVPGGGWLVAGTDTASGDGDIALWRVTSSGEVSRRDRGETALSGPGEQTATNISVDADGRVLLAGSDYGRAGLWESDTVDR